MHTNSPSIMVVAVVVPPPPRPSWWLPCLHGCRYRTSPSIMVVTVPPWSPLPYLPVHHGGYCTSMVAVAVPPCPPRWLPCLHGCRCRTSLPSTVVAVPPWLPLPYLPVHHGGYRASMVAVAVPPCPSWWLPCLHGCRCRTSLPIMVVTVPPWLPLPYLPVHHGGYRASMVAVTVYLYPPWQGALDQKKNPYHLTRRTSLSRQHQQHLILVLLLWCPLSMMTTVFLCIHHG